MGKTADDFVKKLFEIFGEENVIIYEPDKMERTLPLMMSDNYKDRLKAEYQQALYRYEKLLAQYRRAYRGEFAFNCGIHVIGKQLGIMKMYLNVLEDRCFIEGINLCTCEKEGE